MAWADRPPFERAALRYCAPLGIPLSTFMGRTVYPGEPVWSEDDLFAALDWQTHEAELCSGCGRHMSDTFGPDHQDKWNAEMSGHCDACIALHRAALTADGRDDPITPTVGARFRLWHDGEETDGDVELTA